MDDIFQSVKQVLRRHVKEPYTHLEYDPDLELAALGFKSLDLVGFMLDLEASLNIRFPAEMINSQTFFSIRTVAETVSELQVQREQ